MDCWLGLHGYFIVNELSSIYNLKLIRLVSFTCAFVQMPVCFEPAADSHLSVRSLGLVGSLGFATWSS